jgi:hypothetical protein
MGRTEARRARPDTIPGEADAQSPASSDGARRPTVSGSPARCARARLVTLALILACTASIAGPIEVYREGARFCPRDRDIHGAVLDEAQTIERGRTLLPDRYCGPTTFVDDCDVQTEYAIGSWRVYFHQYRLRNGQHDWGGLTHTYVILDPVGNCFANIPGTEMGATR